MLDADGMSDPHTPWDRFFVNVIPITLFVGLPLLFLVMIVAAFTYMVLTALT